MSDFGKHVRTLRLAKQEQDKNFTLRKVAKLCGVSPTFLSRVETGREPSMPSEEVILRMAEILGENSTRMLALADRIPSRLKAIIISRPELFERLILELENAPEHAILRVVREVRDGNW